MNHLQQLNITFGEHFLQATKYSFISFHAGFIFLIHAFFPNLFITTGSTIIRNLHKVFQQY
jgi:hypothetical protein